MSTSNTVLHILEDSADNVDFSKSFCIETEINSIKQEEYDKAYNIISNAKKTNNTDFKYYEIIWTSFLNPKRADLAKLLILSSKLKDTVEDGEFDEIICCNLPKIYTLLVKDLFDNKDIETAVLDGKKSSPPGCSSFINSNLLFNYLLSLITILPIFLDQIISNIYCYFKNMDMDSGAVYIPDIARLNSMVPVLNYTEDNYQDYVIAVTPMFISWKLSRFRGAYSELDPYSVYPISLFSSSWAILFQLNALLVYVPSYLFGNNRLQDELVDILEEEYGIPMERTVCHVINKYTINSSLLRSIALCELMSHPGDEYDHNDLVVGTYSALGRALVVAAVENNSDPHLIPHSVAPAASINPPPELINYVAGEYEKEVIKDSDQVLEQWRIKVTGRPYLDQLQDIVAKKRADRNRETTQILIASQPLKKIRDKFISFSLLGAEMMSESDPVNVVIKTHPSEDPKIYEDLVSEADYNRVPISVHGDNLYKHLAACDMTITVHSNVGLEAMVVGGICVSVDPIENRLWQLPYISNDVVPNLHNKKEVEDFFNSLSCDRQNIIKKSQRKFIEQNFLIDGNSAKRISEQIMSD